MKTVQGDLIAMALDGQFDVIMHGANCFQIMGAGIAKQIAANFPEAVAADKKTIRGSQSKLGTCSHAKITGYDLYVVNAYTQFNLGKDARYEAIRSCFREIKRTYPGLRIAYPAIGCGIGGLDWKIVSAIINEELEGENHTFVSYGK